MERQVSPKHPDAQVAVLEVLVSMEDPAGGRVSGVSGLARLVCPGSAQVEEVWGEDRKLFRGLGEHDNMFLSYPDPASQWITLTTTWGISMHFLTV